MGKKPAFFFFSFFPMDVYSSRARFEPYNGWLCCISHSDLRKCFLRPQEPIMESVSFWFFVTREGTN